MNFSEYWQEKTTPDRNFIQGFEPKEDGTAQSIGRATREYETWRAEGRFLVLSGKGIGNGRTTLFPKSGKLLKSVIEF